MKKAFIHIGSGKTGTSSIQNALFENERNGETLFRYPVVHGKGHQSIAVLFKSYERISRGLKSKFEKEGGYEEFKKNYENTLSRYSEEKNILFSSELMFNFNLSEVEQFRRYLEDKGFDEFKVVVYLREPASYYLSLVQQKVKAAYKVPSPLSFKAGYSEKLANWVGVFGEDVCVRRFDRSLMVGGNVLEDFSVLVNEFFNGDLCLTGSSANESVSAEGMVLLQEFRRFFFSNQEDRFSKKSNTFLKKIQDVEYKFPGSKPALKNCYARKINSLNRDYFDILKDFNLLSSSELGKEGVVEIDDSEERHFTGCVIDLLHNFDENHYKFVLHKVAYDSI